MKKNSISFSKENLVNFIFLIVSLLFSLIGCSGNGENINAAEDYKAESYRGLDKITDMVVNDLDDRIQEYLLFAYDPAKSVEAETCRRNLQIRIEAYYPGLKEALIHGDDTQMQIAAVSLGILNDAVSMSETVPMLTQFIIKSATDDDMRYRALLGLGLMQDSLRYFTGCEIIKEDGTKQQFTRETLLYAIAYNLSHPILYIRETAVKALGYALKPDEKPELIDALILRLSEEPEIEVKTWVIFALSKIGSNKGYEAISSQALNDINDEIRIEAVVALGNSQKPEYIPALIGRLQDKQSAIRSQAIMMLKGFRTIEDKQEEIAYAIEELLNDIDYKVRRWAALALGDMGVKKVVPRLIAKLGDREISVQLAAVQSLGKLSDERAIEPLINALAARDAELRQHCRYALGKITGADLGEDANTWQEWFNSKMPPVSPTYKASNAPKLIEDENNIKPTETDKSEENVIPEK